MENTKIEEVKESDYVVVLDPPEKPIVRSRPKKKFILIITGTLSLLLGFIVSFSIYMWEKQTKDEKKKVKNAKRALSKNIAELLPFKQT